MSVLALRLAQPGDGEAITALLRDSAEYYCELAPDDFRHPDDAGQAAWLDASLPLNGEDKVGLVAELGGEVVGYVEARLQEALDSARYQADPALGEPRLFIGALLTARAHWRQGVASALVTAVESWGRERGATIAVMDTYAESPVSVPFWQAQGYRTRALIMRKRLL